MILVQDEAGKSEPNVLRRITVRLVEAHERPEFDRWLREQHYLHDSTLAGQNLR